MKRSKKLLSLLLCMALLFTMMPTTAFAAGGAPNAAFSISENTVEVGDTFTVTIGNKEMTVSSYASGIQFDKDMLKVVSVAGTANPNRPDVIYLKTNDDFSPWVSLTAESSVSQANANGQVGFAYAGSANTTYAEFDYAVVTFEAIAAGTTEVRLYEDSAGTDAYKNGKDDKTGLFNEYAEIKSITITVPKTEFKGSVAISGNAVYDETLTAVVTDTEQTMNGEAQYQWYRDGSAITGATENTYKLVKEDIGKKITVSVQGEHNQNAATSAAVGPVDKATRTDVPTGCVVNNITEKSFSAFANGDVEYSINGEDWQSPRAFNHLQANTEYTVYFRYAESKTHYAGPVYTVKATTLKKTQTIEATKSSFDVKYGNTLDLSKIFSSNAKDVEGFKMTYTLSEGADATLNGSVVTVGRFGSKPFTVTANSGEVGTGSNAYYAAEPVSITVNILDKDAAEFDSDFEEDAELMVGGTLERAAQLTVGDAKADTFTYKSSNEAVVKVDADGKVTAVGKGKATITVTAPETKEFKLATASYEVTAYQLISYAEDLGITKPVKYETAKTTVAAGTGYGEATIRWSPALVDGKFAAGTAYTATVRLIADTANFYKFAGCAGDKTVKVEFPATAAPDQLKGTVTIKPDEANEFGQYEFNDTLTADISGLNYGAEARFEPQKSLSYQWLRDGKEINGATSASYKLVKEDIGAMISVVVESDYNEGTVTSDAVGPVSKATNLTAVVYHVETTSSSITIIAEDCGYELEYTIDEGKTWRDDNQFTGLRPNRQYFVGARCKETETHKAGPATISSNVKTDPLPQIITATQGTDLEIKYGRTIRLHDYFKSNAMGSYLTFKVTKDGDEVEIENKSLDLGDQIGVTYTIVASSGAFGEYAAADDVTITITVVPKSKVEIDSTFEEPVEALKTDANITNKVATVITEGYDGNIVYSSSNSDVAAVNRETGEVDIIGPGEVTITAMAQATAEFEYAECAYVLTVYDIADVNNIAITAPVKYAEPQTSVEDGAGYAGGKITWSVDGETFTGSKFGRETVYTAAVTLTAKDGFKFADGKDTYIYTHTFPATAGFDPLGGTAAITGTPVFGQTLEADITGLNYGAEEQGEITYQWYRVNGENKTEIADATGKTYTPDADDIGKKIMVEVRNSFNTGSVMSAATGKVEKEAGPAAVVPTEFDVTADSIAVKNPVEGQVYSIDKQIWNAEGVFTGLKANKEYTVHTRVAETATAYAGDVATTTVRTDMLITSVEVAVEKPVKYAAPQAEITATDFYTGTILWNPAHDEFAPNTAYTATVVLKAKDGYWFSKDIEAGTVSENGKTLTIVKTYDATAGYDALSGKVEIKGEAIFGKTLTADISGLIYGQEEQGEITYQWYRDGEAIEGATGAEYELVKEDIGAYIDVRVKNSLNTGSVENEGDFGPVQKAAAKETVKAEVTATADTITVTNVTEGQVYSIDGQTWNAEGVFTGLEAYTEYTVYTKVAETDVTEEGSVETTAIRTLKLAQVITAEQDEITVKFGKTFDIKTIVKSNAEGAQLVITAEGTLPEGTTFENGVVKAGKTEGTFTVKVNSAAIGKYDAAEEVTITVKITAKDAQVFESGFTGRIVKTYGDSKFGRTAVLKTGNGKITYTSTNPEVAAVDAAGGVTIVGAGETVITATAAETEDFAKASVSYTVVVNKKQLAVPTVSGTYTYNGADQTAAITGFDADAMIVIGNVAKNAGTYSVVVTLMDNVNCEWADGTSAAKTLEWSIAKATVTGKPEFTKIKKKDKTLADAPITVGTITVPGTVAWDDPAETVVEKNKYYGWTFTPADTDNYEVLKGEFKVYTTSSGGGGTSGGGGGGFGGLIIPEEPVFVLGEGVTLDLSEDGTHAKFVVADGYKIVDVLKNGASRGPVTELKYLEDGDKIEVITEKLETVTAESIKAELVKVKLVARSKVVKMKSGKPAIRLNWYDKYGNEINYDGYQIFRSTQRYKGFGKKPLYTTVKTTYYNTAIKPQVMYYYKVRGFIEFNGKKIYTEWSDKAWRKVGKDKFK